ncbi:MAG TPA: 1,4-dihydroxy-2-naphthoate octaprenyltransferase [Thermomicrobiales bacterium]|nr:1,4-dihydroxy-2-naphthoate octaprenyltransferase [Thermomicrobiales bacterium]
MSGTPPIQPGDRDPFRNRRVLELLLTIAGPVLIVGIWELLSRFGRIDSRFWPAPSSLWDTAGTMVREDDLLGDVRITVFRILVGFLIGAVPGIALGLAMGLFWPVRVFFMPLATVIYAIPKIAVLPLMIIAFGTGEASKLITVALSIFFLVALSTMSGVLELDRSFKDVARNLGADRRALFLTVALPGAMPSIFTGLRLALGFALVVVVGTEFVNADRGLGAMIWSSYQTLRIRQMFVGLMLTGFLGLALTASLGALERLAMPWRQSDTRVSSVTTWLRAVRFRSFTTSTIPVIAATMLAYSEGQVRWAYFVLMLMASVLTHAACNLTNDYFDEVRGVDSDATLGQSGVLQAGALTHAELRMGIAVCFSAALACALPIIADVGMPIFWLALASAAAAFFYTAGPFPLAYYALGEVTVFFAMGIGMVTGTFYVHTGTVTWGAILLATALGLLSAGFLHANNVRDIETDQRQRKRTLANLLGRRAATIEFGFLVAAPFLCAVAMIAIQPGWLPLLIVGLAIPRAITLTRQIRGESDPAALNMIVRRAAGLHLQFGVLVSLGLLVATVFAS